jgi:hypothetical protein
MVTTSFHNSCLCFNSNLNKNHDKNHKIEGVYMSLIYCLEACSMRCKVLGLNLNMAKFLVLIYFVC